MILKQFEKYYPTDIAKIYPNEIVGKRFLIKPFELTEKEVKHEKMMARIRGNFKEVQYLEPGKYVKLVDDSATFNRVIMSDTGMELDTNLPIVEQANHNVLIGGLGLGIIALAIERKPEVDSITIVEKEKEIIDLITKYVKFSDKVKIVHGDIFEFKPTQKYNTIYFDIWNDICGDNYADMKSLKRKFRKFLDKNSGSTEISCWRESDTRTAYKKEVY